MRNSALVTTLLCLASGSASALYNPAPDPSLAAVQGEWVGTLTYRDYSQPDKMVTLPTRVFIALGAPSELVLQRAPEQPAGMRLTCEHAEKGKVERYRFVLTPERLAISKEEIEPSGASLLRNQYSFGRK
jgi:hypothetical protein